MAPTIAISCSHYHGVQVLIMSRKILIIWLVFSIALVSGLGYLLFVAEAKNTLLIGEATHGHHQIEMACEACHTSSFGGPEVLQDACVGCHQEELDNAHDSHPRKKFTDPRNAELAKKLDATQCVTCHVEHQLEQTKSMGVTVPDDVCFHCHEQVVEQRETHKGLGFDTCATSGCHNFHDNRALYESFLVKNAGKPWVNYEASMPIANNARLLAPKGDSSLSSDDQIKIHPDIVEAWSQSKHALAEVNCASCHSNESNVWVEKPKIDACQSCHESEFDGFVSSKHGMRLAPSLSYDLSPMSPEKARLDFHEESLTSELTCSACHDPHQPNLQTAAVDSCLGCHADQHSLAYESSPHARAKNTEINGHGKKKSGVTCATCHMPTEQHKKIIDKATRTKKISVQHNQSATLKPNEKMIRPVCLQCHSLEFSIDALADETLILNNFNGKPSIHVESVDWAVERDKR